MLTYNTQLERLVMPEYGRNVQKMVEYCMTLPDKEQRNACAAAIVRSITQLLPDLAKQGEIAKVWDHLAIISDFKLDIDYPAGCMTTPESLNSRPDTVPYGRTNVKHRQYGRLLEAMIEYAATLSPEDGRDDMVFDIANQMKKAIVNATGEDVDDRKIFDDLLNMSNGALRLDPETTVLMRYEPAPQPTGKKKRKK